MALQKAVADLVRGTGNVIVRSSSWDIEERVVAVVARLAGLSASHVRPDLRLRMLGCEGAKVIDLIHVLEDEFEVSSDRAGFGLQVSPDTVWDIVKLFHRAQHGAPRTAIRVGYLTLEL
jgi:hypothetical protein